MVKMSVMYVGQPADPGAFDAYYWNTHLPTVEKWPGIRRITIAKGSAGDEFYQIMVGGSAGHDASLGEFLGKALARDQIVDGLSKVLTRYLSLRSSAEDRFIDVLRRVGPAPFKEAVYGPPTIRQGVTHADH